MDDETSQQAHCASPKDNTDVASTRKCILHYNYLFQRLFQIVNMPQYLKWFPLLKSKPKLKNLDNMWWEICDQTGIPKTELPLQTDSMR